ncbi:MAG: RES family NAD+ phosphorylase [Gemmatirosa sp.]|nr:RES family NAD+ phosphorylase [Gemmatirosa sp.]
MTGAPLPDTALVRRFDTHRLVPSRYRPGGESVLALIADDDAHLADLFDLDHATNERLLAEHDRQPAIGRHELVFGVPGYRVVNAAFAHAHPLGSRFNGPERGAWYAAFELETAQAEVAFHRSADLAEIGRFEDSVTYDDYLSDVSAALHDLRGDARFADCLAPDSYVASQELAESLLEAGALGVVYPSVRREGGTCVALFRPALVGNVRPEGTYRFTWAGGPEPRVTLEARGS